MFRVFVILVRTSYLLAAMIVLACVLPSAVKLAQSLSRSQWFAGNAAEFAFSTLVLAVLLYTPARALVRLCRRAELIPDSHRRERPVVAFLVGVGSVLGCALFLLVAWTRLSTLPEANHANFAGPLILAFLLFALALLIGELVLVGRIRPDKG